MITKIISLMFVLLGYSIIQLLGLFVLFCTVCTFRTSRATGVCSQ